MNVKGHVYFKALLAQIDELKFGTSVDARIMSALNNSLEICYRILKARNGEAKQVKYVEGFVSNRGNGTRPTGGMFRRKSHGGESIPVWSWRYDGHFYRDNRQLNLKVSQVDGEWQAVRVVPISKCVFLPPERELLFRSIGFSSIPSKRSLHSRA